MEEQIKNLDARTTAIEHILPTLATKDDLRLSTEALQDDLRLTTEALQHEIETGFEAAKAHAGRLNEVTREQIRFVADQVALVNRQMATKGELQQLSTQMASKRDLQQLQQTLSAQIAALGATRRNRKH